MDAHSFLPQLALLFAVTTVCGFICLRLKQPVVLGYLLAGFLLGNQSPFGASFFHSQTLTNALAEFGVVFLLFSVGLEFNLSRLASVGGKAFFAGLLETSGTFLVTFLVAKLLHFSTTTSLLVAAMLCVSSTTLAVKTFNDLQLRGKRFVELVYSLLLIEDLLAVVLLVVLSAMMRGEGASDAISLPATMVQLVVGVGGCLLVGSYFLPRVTTRFTWFGGNEMLLLLSLSLCFSLVSLTVSLRFSSALGAFLVGTLLSETGQVHRIERLIHPLRDIFGALFFVSIGMMIAPAAIAQNALLIAVLTIAVVVAKSCFTTAGLSLVGESPGDALRSGFSLVSIGEFSFVIAALGRELDVIDDAISSSVIAAAILSIFISPALIRLGMRKGDALATNRFTHFLRRTGESFRTTFFRKVDAVDAVNKMAITWLSCAIVVTLTTFFTARVVMPKFNVTSSDAPSTFTLFLVALAAINLPFAATMFTPMKYRRVVERVGSAMPSFLLLLFFRVLTLICLSLLAKEFISNRAGIVLSMVVLAIIALMSYKRVEGAYEWVEARFLRSRDEAKTKKDRAVSHLAPWDSHLSRFEISPYSELAGRSLIELELRDKAGINVVAIERAGRTIAPPQPDERLLPYDEVLVLGTELHVANFSPRTVGEAPQGEEAAIENYKLTRFSLQNGSTLIGKTIRESQIRERFGCMVVGVERYDKRYMNPPSDMALEKDDVIWITGSSRKLKQVQDITHSSGKVRSGT